MISFVFPVRNDFPHILYTTYSHMNSLADPNDDFEVLWMVNAPDPEFLKWLEHVKNGRLHNQGFLKIFIMDRPGAWPAVRRGFQEAKGDVMVWGCSHTFVWGDTIQKIVDLARQEGGIVHSCGLYMKDFTTAEQGRRWKLHGYGDPVFRGLRFFRLRDTPYTIVSGAGNVSAVQRNEWFRLGGGVEPNMTLYGGAETYMDLKWWLLGSKVWCHPQTLKFHWTYDRAWRKDEYAKVEHRDPREHFRWNQMVAIWCVGGDEWVYKTYGEKTNELLLDAIREVCADSRQFILDNQVYDGLDALFEAEPWDYPKKANPKHGVIRSY